MDRCERKARLSRYDVIYGARLRASDGVVLDPDGIRLTQSGGPVRLGPHVAFDGKWLLVTSNRSFARLETFRVDPGTGQRSDDPAHPVSYLPTGPNGNLELAIRDGRGVVMRDNMVGAFDDVDGVLSTVTAPYPVAFVGHWVTSMVSATNGNDYLVAWSDWRSELNGKYPIYGARVRGSDHQVLDPDGFLIADDPAHLYAALGSDGTDYLVAYTNRAGNVVTRRIHSADASLEPPQTAGPGGSPQIAADGNNYFISWSVPGCSSSGCVTTHYGRRLGIQSKEWADDAPITIASGQSAGRTSLMAHPSPDPATRMFVLAWTEQSYEPEVKTVAKVKMARIAAASGAPLDGPSGLTISRVTDRREDPTVLPIGNDAVVAWIDRRSSSASITDAYATRVRLVDGAVLDGVASGFAGIPIAGQRAWGGVAVRPRANEPAPGT